MLRCWTVLNQKNSAMNTFETTRNWSQKPFKFQSCQANLNEKFSRKDTGLVFITRLAAGLPGDQKQKFRKTSLKNRKSETVENFRKTQTVEWKLQQNWECRYRQIFFVFWRLNGISRKILQHSSTSEILKTPTESRTKLFLVMSPIRKDKILLHLRGRILCINFMKNVLILLWK